MYRLVELLTKYLILTLVLFPLPSSGSDPGSIRDQFTKVYSKLSELSSPAFSSMDVSSSGTLLVDLKKEIAGIETVLRINSSGLVVNEVTSGGEIASMRSVANQKWFELVKETLRVYHGTTREPGGKTMLFWAWPTMTGSGRFGGVLAAKIAPEAIVSSTGRLDGEPISVSFNNQTVYQTEKDAQPLIKEIVWVLPDSSKLRIHYSGKNDLGALNQAASDQQTIVLREKEQESVIDSTLNEGVFIDESNTQKKGSGILAWLIIIVIVVFAWILARKFNRKKVQRENTFFTDVETSGDVVSEKNEDFENAKTAESNSITQGESDSIGGTMEDTKTSNEKRSNDITTLSAEETCERIKTFISDDQYSTFRSAASSSELFAADSDLRNELYRQIHGQITHWVQYESARLSKCLEELSERVGRLEKSDAPEIARIRNEAQRISKEIALFKENLSDGEL